MLTLPPAVLNLFAPCAPCRWRRIWPHAVILVLGTFLATDRRTVATTLRAVGRDQDKRFGCDHRVLSRARWSGLAVGCGATIAAKGIDRHSVRSSYHGLVVKASGLRWVCRMLLVPVP